MKSHDMRVRTDEPFRGTARPRREEREYRENTRRKRKEAEGEMRGARWGQGG